MLKNRIGALFSLAIFVPALLLFAAQNTESEPDNYNSPVYSEKTIEQKFKRLEILEGPTPTPVPTPSPTPAPTPQPLPEPVYVPVPKKPVSPQYPQWAIDLICSYDWDCYTALRIAACESHLDPNAVNSQGSGASGLFQIMLPLHLNMFEGASPFDPVANTRVAYKLWTGKGFYPWACY